MNLSIKTIQDIATVLEIGIEELLEESIEVPDFKKMDSDIYDVDRGIDTILKSLRSEIYDTKRMSCVSEIVEQYCTHEVECSDCTHMIDVNVSDIKQDLCDDQYSTISSYLDNIESDLDSIYTKYYNIMSNYNILERSYNNLLEYTLRLISERSDSSECLNIDITDKRIVSIIRKDKLDGLFETI